MKVVSYADANKSLGSILDRTINDVDVTLIHRRKGGNAVVMSEEYYNSVMETLYLLSTPSNAKALERAIAQDKKNRSL